MTPGWLAIPLVHDALVVVAWAAAIPLALGLTGRLFFYRRDADDAALHPRRAPVQAMDGQHEPESEVAYGERWPEFPPTAAPSPETVAPFVYRGSTVDRGSIKSAIEAIWKTLADDPQRRERWGLAKSTWEHDAPYALAGAQGASAASGTLSVSIDEDAPAADHAALRQIWEQELLPELRQQFGANAFRPREPDR